MNTLSKMLYAIGERVHKLENKDMPTTVKINNGGTGATTASAARKNLLENKPLSVAEGGTGLTHEYQVKNWLGPFADQFVFSETYPTAEQTISSTNTPIYFTQHSSAYPTSCFKANSNGHITYIEKSSAKWYEWPENIEKFVRIDVLVTPVSISAPTNTLNLVIRGKNNVPLVWKTFYGDEVRGGSSFEASVTVPLDNTFDIYASCAADKGTVTFDSQDGTYTSNTSLTLTVLN